MTLAGHSAGKPRADPSAGRSATPARRQPNRGRAQQPGGPGPNGKPGRTGPGPADKTTTNGQASKARSSKETSSEATSSKATSSAGAPSTTTASGAASRAAQANGAADGTPQAPAKRRIAFVDIGRALGALFVVYSHFDWLFLRENKDEVTWFSKVFEDLFVAPLRLTDQGIGAVAVPFFFLASGFVVTPIALRLGAGRFAVNRTFRVYPLLIFVVAVSVTVILFGLRPLTTGEVGEVTVGSVLTNISLVNFFDKPMVAFVGVAWTLAVEVLFYVLITALLPVLRRIVWLAIAIELEVVVLVLSTHAQFGENYRAIAVNVAYLAMPILGQVLWAAWERKIPVWLAACYLAVGWGLFVWAGNLSIDPDYIPRPYPFAVAVVLFLLGMFAERYLRERRVWTELSERTYSIYLLHGVVGFPLMFLVYDAVPVWLTLLIGVLGTAVAVEIAYRLVERPSHNLGRRLSRSRRTQAEATPDPPAADATDTPADDPGPPPRARRAPEPESEVERTDVLPRVARRSRPAREPDLPSMSGQLTEETPPVPAHGNGPPGGPGVPARNGQAPTPYARRGNGAPRHARPEPRQSGPIQRRLDG